MVMDSASERFLVICFIVCVLLSKAICFQSDELQDDEEWGLVGGRPAEPDYTLSLSTPTTPRSKIRQDNSAADSKVQFVLEHAFGGSDFSPAGVFSARLKVSPHGGQTLTKLRLSRNSLIESEQKAFEELLKEDGFYKIRVSANVLTPGEDYVLSSTKARCLSAADLEERFIIHMEGVNIIAITFGPTGGCSYPRLLKYPTRWSFSSHTVLKSSEQSSRMLTMTEDIMGHDNEGEEDEAKKPPERSFWSKYWMYAIPLGLIVMNAITQAMNMPEEQAAGRTAGHAGQASVQAGPQRIANSGTRRR